MRCGIVYGKESALGAWGWSRRVALIKSLIYARKKRSALGAGLPSSAEKSLLIIICKYRLSQPALSKCADNFFHLSNNFMAKLLTGNSLFDRVTFIGAYQL